MRYSRSTSEINNNYRVENRHSTIQIPRCRSVNDQAVPKFHGFRISEAARNSLGSGGKRGNIRNGKLCTSLCRAAPRRCGASESHRLLPAGISISRHLTPADCWRRGETGCTQLLRLLGSFITLTKRSPNPHPCCLALTPLTLGSPLPLHSRSSSAVPPRRSLCVALERFSRGSA